MRIFETIDTVTALLFAVFALHQYVYAAAVLLMKNKKQPEVKVVRHSYAVLICARNEENVIGELLDALSRQTWGREGLCVFVMADNCTDGTAAAAAKKGARVYERHDLSRIGKGYALEELMKRIRADHPEGFDGYFVFDADNVPAEDFVEKMNACFCRGYDAVTAYRNSKNYGDNWISAGYALWFLRDSRYLNHARSLLGISCSVTGTGFLFSRKIAEEMSDWPYHLLTEDAEFTADMILKGKKIGFCPEAEFFDEQPTSFSQSVRQRLRWSKGYFQVLGAYGPRLLLGALRGNFSCLENLTSVLPAFVLPAVSLLSHISEAAAALIRGVDGPAALLSLLCACLYAYAAVFVCGALTALTERRHIRAPGYKFVLSVFTLPLFMFTYLPIAAAALFARVEWKPIRHGK